jgi:chromosome partitioning protein
MSMVAVYNMKGGVGKTTTAVNLSYFAAAAGQRTLLWDLDPQGASSFAFRVRPRVEGFGKKSLEDGHELAAAIKETDYQNLDLLPADFAYRKVDRLLDHLGKPERVVTALLGTLGRNYDAVFLDCPAGFSMLTEGIFAAADAVLVPTIPTVLSLRTVARMIKWADRSDSTLELAAFFSMVDRRKALHRRACEWSAAHPEVFLAGQVPYASVVEEMAVRRMPLAAFAPRDPATIAFAAVWAEFQSRLEQRKGGARPADRWEPLLRAIESLILRLDSAEGQDPSPPRHVPAVTFRASGPLVDLKGSQLPEAASDLAARSAVENVSPRGGGVHFVHRFDTDRRDLQRCGYVLELHERAGSLVVLAAQSSSNDGEGAVRSAQARVDRWWAMQILSGAMSPLEALERKPGRPVSGLLENIRATVGGQRLRRIHSSVAGQTTAAGGDDHSADSTSARGASATIREAGRVNPGELRIMQRR